MPLKREEIKKEDKWNVEAIYKDDNIWEDDYKSLKEDVKKIIQFKGKLKNSSTEIKNLLEFDINLSRKMNLLYLYSHMKNDEDSKNEKYKSYHEKMVLLINEYEELASWITPELLSIDDNIMNNYLKSEELAPYKFHLEKILRNKNYTLNENEEKIIAMASMAMTTAEDAFRSLNDADFKFEPIKSPDNKLLELTHATYHLYLIDKDRNIRENAFKIYHKKYNEFAMTMATLLYGKVKEHVFNAKVRNFKDSLTASLYYKNIDTSVYTNLIETVKSRISSLHNYMKFRRQVMGLDEIHLYDVYVPFVDSPEIKISYDEAKDILLNSVKILGDEYHDVLNEGINKNGWVDKYENENKRSGAYSTGCYDSMPYILMNYNGTLNSAKTLAHEAGHSMHSYFTHKYQPPIYGNYPIFLAEVASTFNEELFNQYLINNSKDKKISAYLLNTRLEEIRATLFRQVMFAEFELMIHKLVEQDIPLTFQLLKKEYRKLNEFYFGNEVIIDDEIEIEWARIPHFYYNFYVYQYATGISAAIALFNKVTKGDDCDLQKYLNFLKAGSSRYPIDILKDAGVDMTVNYPINQAIDYFDKLLDELKKVI
jgi:oligoendopeptidase F